MNFFFGFKNNFFFSELVIPKFQNCGKKKENYTLFSAEIENGQWLTKKFNSRDDKDFFYLMVQV